MRFQFRHQYFHFYSKRYWYGCWLPVLYWFEAHSCSISGSLPWISQSFTWCSYCRMPPRFWATPRLQKLTPRPSLTKLTSWKRNSTSWMTQSQSWNLALRYVSVCVWRVSTYVSLLIFSPVQWEVHPSVCSCTSLFVHLSLSQSIRFFVHPCIYSSICLFIHPSLHPSLCLSICLFIYPCRRPSVSSSIRLFINLSVCLSFSSSISLSLSLNLLITVDPSWSSSSQ